MSSHTESGLQESLGCNQENRILLKFNNVYEEKKVCQQLPNTCKLLTDKQCFIASLPRRSAPGYIYRNSQHDYFASNEDIKSTIQAVEDASRPTDSTRNKLAFLAAPPGRGKTSTGPLVFAGSELFKHYLYLPFQNNNAFYFRVLEKDQLSMDKQVAEAQGAAAMLECVDLLLRGAASRDVKMPQAGNVPSLVDLKHRLAAMLRSAGIDDDAKILAHVDEHLRFCEFDDHDSPQRNEAKSAFRRGGMELLSQQENVVVFATYLEPPYEIPEGASSGSCRIAVPLPTFNVLLFMKRVEPLQGLASACESYYGGRDAADLSGDAAETCCLWQTLVLRLSCYFNEQVVPFQAFLHGRASQPLPSSWKESADQVTSACDEVEMDASKGFKQLNSAVSALIRKCTWPDSRRHPDPHAVEMFAGVDSSELESLRRQVRQIVNKDGVYYYHYLKAIDAVPSDREDLVGRLHGQGRTLFLQYVKDSGFTLYSKPLEAAYVWSLAVKFGKDGFVDLKKKEIEFRIKRIQPLSIIKVTKERNAPPSIMNAKKHFKCSAPNDEGVRYCARMSPGGQIKVYELSLKKTELGVLYFADDIGRAHPFCDIFFFDDDKKLVLISVTGGVGYRVETRFEKLADFVRGVSEHFPVCGFVLAPNDYSTTCRDEKELTILVQGSQAARLMGALSQLQRCMLD